MVIQLVHGDFHILAQQLVRKAKSHIFARKSEPVVIGYLIPNGTDSAPVTASLQLGQDKRYSIAFANYFNGTNSLMCATGYFGNDLAAAVAADLQREWDDIVAEQRLQRPRGMLDSVEEVEKKAKPMLEEWLSKEEPQKES